MTYHFQWTHQRSWHHWSLHKARMFCFCAWLPAPPKSKARHSKWNGPYAVLGTVFFSNSKELLRLTNQIFQGFSAIMVCVFTSYLTLIMNQYPYSLLKSHICIQWWRIQENMYFESMLTFLCLFIILLIAMENVYICQCLVDIILKLSVFIKFTDE